MTETVGLDWSLARPNPAALGAFGYTFAMRYVSPLGSGRALGPGLPNPKDVTADELQAILDAGMALGLVFESTADRALAGSGAGHDDGQVAAARAAQVGYPHECVMYWAVDFPAPASALPTIQAYGEGFAAGWGGPEHGPYGSAAVIDYCAPHFPRAWQTAAWSGGVLSPNADILQRATPHHPLPASVSATDVDENVLCRPTVPLMRTAVVPLPSPPSAPPAARPAAFDAAAWVSGWRANQGDAGAVYELLQRWGNATYPGYCRIGQTAPVYGPATAAFLREFAHRCGIGSADGKNIGPKIAAALVAQGFAAYLQRVGFRG